MRNSPRIPKKGKLVLVNSSSIINFRIKDGKGMNGLDKSYRDTIQEMFGEKGLKFYDANVFLHQKSISNTIMSLVSNKELLDHLENYCNVCKTGIDIHSFESQPALVQEFVDLYLYFLKKTIGPMYPNGPLWSDIHNGFKDFYKKLIINNIDLIVVSKYDEELINKVFKLHGLEKPMISITPKVEFDPKLSWDYDFLPEPDLVAPAIKIWSEMHPEFSKEYIRRNVIYIGNDINSDWGMAQKAKIQFWLFNQYINNKRRSKNLKTFSNYSQLVAVLKKKMLFI